MGEHNVETGFDEEKLRRFSRALLSDLRALETMLEQGRIEHGRRRIGAEQEMFLVDDRGRPSPCALEMLDWIGDPRFTTELARFNLEANLTPQPFGGSCLRDLEEEVTELLARATDAASVQGSHVLLTGILPTLLQGDLGFDNMTPNPRYFMLNDAMVRARNGAFEFSIKGVDELVATHDNVMLEACNTSFQLHFQVGAEEFARLYNLAQAITAPVLACAVNSPVLLGRRLWHETRVALFQQSVDTRSQLHHQRGQRSRVHFGDHWLEGSVADLFREDIARFRIMIGADIEEDSELALAEGRLPELRALRLHNGTIYRWNRPCFGMHEGHAHLRIENRVLPAGPTVLDEIANAALFYGLMAALSEDHPDITEDLDFDDAKANFVAAARSGLKAQLTWLDGREHPASRLLARELLPLARQGLTHAGITSEDQDRYLGTLEQRIDRHRTGAQWAFDSLAKMPKAATSDERMRSLTLATLKRQASGAPIHEWTLAALAEAGGWRESYRNVSQFMTTDVFTVRPEDIVDLAANLMDWGRLRHVPVEDDEGRLVGLVSHRSLLRLIARGDRSNDQVTVREIMKRDPVSIPPDTPTLRAIDIMRREQVGCLPVVEKGKLVGVVTEADLIRVAGELLEQHLSDPEEAACEE
ncbi:MAG: glutamate-cysteine ligase family protein [Planctomycetota bacterium]